jgi:hypothetical protein
MTDVDHDWLELVFGETARRWCCTAYADGGCGCYQVFRVWRNGPGSWFPKVESTCTAETAALSLRRERQRQYNRQRYHRRRARNLSLRQKQVASQVASIGTPAAALVRGRPELDEAT